MTSALARATLARAAGSRARASAKKRSPGATQKPSQRYAREHVETRVERRAAITEVVRRARGGGAATAARADARSERGEEPRDDGERGDAGL